jgi:hypothetical protein
VRKRHRLGLILCGIALTVACTPETPDDPRARTGLEGPTTWRLVAGGEGQAAFLSRPGAAPDIVLWCRGDNSLTVRAHVFKRAQAVRELTLLDKAGNPGMALGNARIQGAVRDDGAMLAETNLTIDATKVSALVGYLSTVRLSGGKPDVMWQADKTDPQTVLEPFLKSCLVPTTKSEAKP